MPDGGAAVRRLARGRAAFLLACALDVEVRKPGNVSFVSPGHGMEAEQFIDSARVASGPLFAPGLRVGERIELAVAATRAAVGCNTNLGIVLLCAPLAAALETSMPIGSAELRAAVRGVLDRLDRQDAAAAYRAIALANPGGLGRVEEEDVAAAPSVDLRTAMALARDRDSVARQYVEAYADIFDTGLPAFAAVGSGRPTAAVQMVFLSFLAGWPDTHIVRKHGLAVAQTVTRQAGTWRTRLGADPGLGEQASFAAWDEAMKARGVNPGTSADLTVCTLFAAALALPGALSRAAPGGGMDRVFRSTASGFYRRPDMGFPAIREARINPLKENK